MSARVGGSAPNNDALRQLQFYEQRLFGEIFTPLLKETTNPTKRRFRGFAELTPHPLMELDHINSPAGINLVQSINPELIISIRFGKILKSPILSMPSKGVLNLHSGLLPDYRGVMATFWALFNGEEEIGTTLHWISDASIDTGEVISTAKVKVQKEKSYLWHVLQLYFSGYRLIEEAVAELSRDTLPISHVQEGTGNYYSFPNCSDIERFIAMGGKLVDDTEYIEFIKSHYLPS